MQAQTLRRVTIAKALSAIAQHPVRRVATERVAIAAALAGRVVADDIVAPEDVPPFARSSVDGFAVVERDVRNANAEHPVSLRIAGEVRMGEAPPGPLAAGCAIRIPTGGALPAGADAVVKIEDCRERDGEVLVLDARDARHHVTERGADIKHGDLLRRSGDVLTGASLGMLAGAGVVDVPLFVRPRVALIVTGDELVAPGKQLRAGEIRDINWLSLDATLNAIGMDAHFAYVRDDRTALERALRDALALSDAVVISGGSSVGERDYTPAVVAAAGAPGVVVHGVRARPGRPTMLGIVGEKPVIGLPGNPVSALVMLETLGKPVLLRLFGKSADAVPVRATLRSSLERDADIERFVPVRLTQGAAGVEAQPLTGTSAQMHILGFADALVRVEAGSGALEAGTSVDALPLSRNNAL
jgi:molybdopterin molybdotransferase